MDQDAGKGKNKKQISVCKPENPCFILDGHLILSRLRAEVFLVDIQYQGSKIGEYLVFL